MPANYTPPVVEFLSKDEREDWFNRQVTFVIVEAEETQGQFGLSANYKLVPMDENGELGSARYMSIALTDQKTGATIKRRTDELDWMIQTLAEASDHMVGPLVLQKTPTTKGNPAWGFKAAS